MKYFKIITDNKFIGVVCSIDFKAYNPISKLILLSDENNGQFVRYNNTLYRDYWMKPITGYNKPYVQANIIEIEKDEYLTFLKIIEDGGNIEDSSIITPIEPVIPEPDVISGLTLEYVTNVKLQELSKICNKTIENGVDVTLLDGKTHHFSLTTQDQLNLISLQAMIEQGLEQIPYHADGELCKFYTQVEIQMIISAATKLKTYHTTYYNALKNYVKSLKDIHQVAAITYGIELPEEYKSDVLKTLHD